MKLIHNVKSIFSAYKTYKTYKTSMNTINNTDFLKYNFNNLHTLVKKGEVDAMLKLEEYYRLNGNYKLTKKYLLMAIEKGNAIAMHILGAYYQHRKRNYVKMKKYLLMAIKNGSSNAANDLGWYYCVVKKNYDKMKKYYLIAIESGNVASMNNLGWHYVEKKDNEQAKKYFKMGVKNGCLKAMGNLINIYDSEKLPIKILKLVITYPHMTKRSDNVKLFNDIAKYGTLEKENKQKFLQLLSNFEFNSEDKLCVALELLINVVKNQLSIMDLHFTYTVNGSGYLDAKEDFFSKCADNK